MSRSPQGALTRRLPLALAAGTASLASLALATSADAAFTTGKCLGDPIIGRGASFAASAHNQVWFPVALPVFCSDAGSTPGFTYNSTGSGSGRRVMGQRTNGSPEGDNTTGAKSRNEGVRFGMTEEPPSTTAQAEINQGTDAAGDEGLSRLIPMATGAVAIVVNVPNGCSISTLPAGGAAPDALFTEPANANKRRLKLTRAQVEGIFDGSIDAWGELVPTINDGNGTAAEAGDTRCTTFPLVRIRRLDDGGTTFVLKDYLHQIDPAEGWATTYSSAPDTRVWPQSSETVAFDYNNDGDTDDVVAECAAQFSPFNAVTCNESAVPLLQTTKIAAPSGNGNDDLVDKVNDYDGSVGYGDLSTARQQRAFAFERQNNATDDRYWVAIQAKDLTTFADAASAANGYEAGGTRGSNCAGAGLRNVPTGDDPTAANWLGASATDASDSGYGICSLTYAIAFDDYSGPYSAQGDQAAEERRARTVRDYLEAALSPTGQGALSTFDYGPIPNSVLALTRDGVSRIGWQKTAGTGGGGTTGGGTTGGGTTGGGTTGGGTTPGGTTTPSPAPTPPSNAFTIPSRRTSAGNILLSVQIPGAGNVAFVATAKVGRRTIRVGSGASSRSTGGVVRLTVKPSAAAKSALKKAKSRKLTVKIAVTYTPTGGAANTRNVTVVLKAAKAKKKAAKRK